ncbi:NAC domain-containing protein 78 [Dichanthelium oligosanthes]|uniref:NAC domain-containing protein 78 n=1 Tax=Dichanthelium oligosanthes TaxID=888268 RepID=A0A1E5UM90_9POAL|nr:NAC domain-containing protein 78 [Dichanthelium oligosanthes]
MEWYFFCPRDKKYPNGSKTNRSTPNGFWKSTGKDRTIVLNTRIVGMKKTLIFHEGKAPRGDRTDWVMYEYRMEDNELDVVGFSKDAYVLCKIFKKSGLGPRIGEKYGAAFNEEEWDNVNTETAFPLMPCPSSKVVGATNEPSVQHTVASTSSVMKEPHVLAVASADGLPFEFSTSSITATDELQYHTLGHNGSEMTTASCASDALDACHPTEFGGISLETDNCVRFLSNSMGNDGGASEKLADLPDISEAEAQALEMNSDYCYHELVRLVESGGASTADNLSPGYVNTECLNPPILFGLGAGDDYLEINDLFPLGGTASFELPAAESQFPQYPLEQCSYNELNRPQYHNEGAFAASFAAGNLIPPISCSMHDISVADVTCSTNLMWNDC